jgi:hypothetical protein
MRLYEFQSTDQLTLLLKNLIGRASSKKQAANFNWASLNTLLVKMGVDQMDYEAFKAAYDSSPILQNLVRNFNAQGVQLKVPGTDQDTEKPGSDIDSSKDKVNQIASSNAMKQISS